MGERIQGCGASASVVLCPRGAINEIAAERMRIRRGVRAQRERERKRATERLRLTQTEALIS